MILARPKPVNFYNLLPSEGPTNKGDAFPLQLVQLAPLHVFENDNPLSGEKSGTLAALK